MKNARRLKLYTYWRSSSAWRVRIALNLKRVVHELVPVDLGPGSDERRSAGLDSKNPMNQIPVLELDDGTCLSQSLAIIDYLDAAFPAPRLLPRDSLLRTRVLQAAEIVNSGIQPMHNVAVLDCIVALGGDRQRFAARFIDKGLVALETLTREQGGEFSVGDELTLADVMLVPQLYNARRFGVSLEPFPRLLAIEARCSALDAFARAHPDAQSDRRTELSPSGEPRPRLSRLLGVHYYVRDLERSRRFYKGAMDFAELGRSSEELALRGKQRSLVFAAGECTIVCSTPEGVGGRAQRYLRKHPDGIGTVVFECENIAGWFQRLERAGATPISDIETHRDTGGELRSFSITTPFGDTTFRFIERRGYLGFFPGMELYESPRGGKNAFSFEHIDHITSNFQTMSPALFWLERVMGFQRFWGIEFHTREVATERLEDGSGLRSAVMRDPETGIKFANNEPYRPFFKRSQINSFNEDHRGDGVQHIALSTPDIIATVRGLKSRGVEFMPTRGTYYDALPARLERLGIGAIDESIDELRELGILVDGAGKSSYLLQIFLQDSAGLYRDPDAGPFFFEVIQRKGDRGFGAGNFRALFESIEREQLKERG